MASAEDFRSLSSVPCSVRWPLVPAPPPEACPRGDEGARDQARGPRACFPQEGWPRGALSLAAVFVCWRGFFLNFVRLSGSSSVISLVILWFLRWKTNDLEAVRQVDVAGGASVSPLSQPSAGVLDDASLASRAHLAFLFCRESGRLDAFGCVKGLRVLFCIGCVDSQSLVRTRRAWNGRVPLKRGF